MNSSFDKTRVAIFSKRRPHWLGYWVAGRASAEEGTPAAACRAPRRKSDLPASAWEARATAIRTTPARHGNVVAICDVDDDRLEKAAERFPDAKKFYDFRDLFDEMSGQIDAVTVSTPDHTHAPASIRAMKEGKAVYCQKPLAHSVWEARRMAESPAR